MRWLVVNVLAAMSFLYVLYASVSWKATKTKTVYERIGAASNHCTNEERLRHLAEICHSIKPSMADQLNGSDRTAFKALIVNDAERIMFCSIPKVACTTFKTLMYYQADRSLNRSVLSFSRLHTKSYLSQHHLRYLNSYGMEEIRKRLKTYRKLLIVRHPFDRLLSAHRDKFLATSYGLQRAVGADVSGYLDDDGKLDIWRFVELLAEAIRSQNTTIINYQDRHWDRQYARCQPCFVHYDYIAKLETISSDWPYVGRFFNASVLSYRHQTDRRLAGTNTTVAELLAKSNLTAIGTLIDYYKYDFELFGYELNLTTDNSGAYIEKGRGLC